MKTHVDSRPVLRSYDFVLQARVQGEPAPLDSLVVALSARGAQLDARGEGVLKVSSGEAAVRPVLENGVTIGLDVRVPFHEKTEQLENVFRVLVDVAEVSEAKLLDPQRGEVASHAGFGATTEEYLRLARYAGEYGGVSEALGLTSIAAMPEENPTSIRWLMVLAVFVVAVYAGWRTVSTIRDNRALAEEERVQQQQLEEERATPRR